MYFRRLAVSLEVGHLCFPPFVHHLEVEKDAIESVMESEGRRLRKSSH